MCLTSEDCNQRGLCEQHKCSCFIGWFSQNEEIGQYCNINLADIYPSAFYIYQSPFNIAMIFLIIIVLIQIFWLFTDPYLINGVFTRISERMINEFIYSLLFTLFGVILIVWYSIFEETIYNSNKESSVKKYIFSFFKCLVKVRIITVYLAQVSTSILKGYQFSQETQYLIIAGYSYLALNFVVFIVEYAFYGVLVYRSLKEISQQYDLDLNEKIKNQNIRIQKTSNNYIKKSKISVFSDKKSTERGLIDHAQFNRQQQLQQIDFQQKKPNIKIEKPPHAFRNQDQTTLTFNQPEKLKIKSINESPNQENIQSNINSIEFSNYPCLKFDIKIDKKTFQTNNIYSWKPIEEPRNIYNNQQLNYYESLKGLKKNVISLNKYNKEVTFIRQQAYVDRSKNELINNSSADLLVKGNKEKINMYSQHIKGDQKILKKILLMIYFGITLQLLFLVLSYCIIFYSLLTIPLQTMLLIYSLEFLKLVSCIAIGRLFSNIKSQTKDNLRWISRVGSKKNNINQNYKLVFPEYLLKDNQNKQDLQKRINFQH